MMSTANSSRRVQPPGYCGRVANAQRERVRVDSTHRRPIMRSTSPVAQSHSMAAPIYRVFITMSSSTPAVSSEFPRRTATYIWPSHRFTPMASIRTPAGDLFICTPPKYAALLGPKRSVHCWVFESPEFDGQISRISPWLDGNTATIEACLDTLWRANPSGAYQNPHATRWHSLLRRFAAISWCTATRVMRTSRLRSHNANLHRAQDSAILSDDPRDGFRAWLDGAIEAGAGDQRSLAAFIHHYQSYHRFAHLPTFIFSTSRISNAVC